MTDTDILDALSALLSSQFEAFLLRADIPAEFLPASTAAPATRTADVVRWMRQQPGRRAVVEAALRRVRDAPASRRGAAPSASAAPQATIPAPATPIQEAPMTAPADVPFQDFGHAPRRQLSGPRLRVVPRLALLLRRPHQKLARRNPHQRQPRRRLAPQVASAPAGRSYSAGNRQG